jgi:hypothetical protein
MDDALNLRAKEYFGRCYCEVRLILDF